MATRFGHIAVQFLDSLGVTVSAPYYVEIDDSKTVAAVLTEVNLLVTRLDAVSDSQITKASIEVVTALPSGIKTAPAASSENEKTGLFNFSQTGSPYKFGVDVPAIADATIVNGKIDLTNSDIQNLKSVLLTVGVSLTYVSTAIRALLNLVDALISFRKHRKAESRRSFEVAS